MILVIDKDTHTILKTMQENDFISKLFESEKFETLYPPYNSNDHAAVQVEALPEYWRLWYGKIKEITKYEAYVLGKYILKEFEKVDEENETVITVERSSSYHTWDSETQCEMLTEGNKTLLLENELNKARAQRMIEFEAMDLYDKAVLRGDLSETSEEKSARDLFRQTWLNIPDAYTDPAIKIESTYPDMPEKIKYFKK